MSVTMEPVRDERYPTWQAQFIGEHKERQARMGAREIVDRGFAKRDMRSFPPAKPVRVPLSSTAAERVIAKWRAGTECAAWLAAEDAIYRQSYRLPRRYSIVCGNELQRPLIEEIQKVTALYYKVSRIDILSRRREAKIVRPRQVAIYIAKCLTLRSLPELGRKFGGRDHTTCLHSIRKIKALRLTDASVSSAITSIAAILSQAGMDVEALGATNVA